MNTTKDFRTVLSRLIALLCIVSIQGCQPIEQAQPAEPLAAPASASFRPHAATPIFIDFGPSADLSTAIRQVSQRVRPSVVQITNEQTQMDQYNQPFDVPAGVGSGVIYDTQGYILTNNHVVEGAQQLLVSLPDGRSFQAKLIGRDPQTDLAVVQIGGTNLPVAALGDSSQLQVGDWLVAIGNALALPGGPTVTVGVASALERTVQEPSDSPRTQGPYLFDLIQTSAPINPGNSGGPLVNLAGQVVGINTMVMTQAEPGVEAQGIGFAISISTAKPIADQLVSTGRVVHANLGMNYIALNAAIAAQLGIHETSGVVVTRVTTGAPAAQAGLKRADVITQGNGIPILDDTDLAQMVSRCKPGDSVTFTVLRASQTMSIGVTLGEMPTP